MTNKTITPAIYDHLKYMLQMGGTQKEVAKISGYNSNTIWLINKSESFENYKDMRNDRKSKNDNELAESDKIFDVLTEINNNLKFIIEKLT